MFQTTNQYRLKVSPTIHYPHMELVATPCRRPRISSALDSLISITETFRVSVTFKGHPTWKCRVGGSVEGNIYRKAMGFYHQKLDRILGSKMIQSKALQLDLLVQKLPRYQGFEPIRP
jgi:hypothetical protein